MLKQTCLIGTFKRRLSSNFAQGSRGATNGSVRRRALRYARVFPVSNLVESARCFLGVFLSGRDQFKATHGLPDSIGKRLVVDQET